MALSGFATPRSAGLRRVSAALAVVFAIAHIGAFHHHAVAEHEYCEEHGELVHAHPQPGAPGPADARGGAADEDRGGPAVHSADEATRGHDAEHAHCHIHPTTREGEAPEQGAEAGKAALRERTGSPRAEAEIAASEAVYQRAPKTSPPAQGPRA